MTTTTDRPSQPFAVRGDVSPVVAALLVLLGAAMYGTIGPLSRVVYAAGVTPLAFIVWRVGVGAVFFAPIVAARAGFSLGRLGLRALDRRSVLVLVAATGFEVGVNLTIFAAFARISVAIALFVLYTFPALAALALVVLGKERLDRVRLVALALATAGVLLVVGGGLDPAGGLRVDPLGVVLALLAAICQASFIVVSRDGFGRLPANTAMAAIMVATGFLGAAFTLIVDGSGPVVQPFTDPPLLALLIGMGAFAGAAPFFLFVTGIHRLGGIRTGTLMLFEPVVGVALAAIFLRDVMTPVQIAGGATVLVAAALVQRGSAHGHGETRELVVPPEVDEGVTFHPPSGL